MNFQHISFKNIHVAPSLGKSMNLEMFDNFNKDQPNGSALRIFSCYCGGVTSHYRYSTNQRTKTSNLNSPKRFSSGKGKYIKSMHFLFLSQFFSHTVFLKIYTTYKFLYWWIQKFKFQKLQRFIFLWVVRSFSQHFYKVLPQVLLQVLPVSTSKSISQE